MFLDQDSEFMDLTNSQFLGSVFRNHGRPHHLSGWGSYPKDCSETDLWEAQPQAGSMQTGSRLRALVSGGGRDARRQCNRGQGFPQDFGPTRSAGNRWCEQGAIADAARGGVACLPCAADPVRIKKGQNGGRSHQDPGDGSGRPCWVQRQVRSHPSGRRSVGFKGASQEVRREAQSWLPGTWHGPLLHSLGDQGEVWHDFSKDRSN